MSAVSSGGPGPGSSFWFGGGLRAAWPVGTGLQPEVIGLYVSLHTLSDYVCPFSLPLEVHSSS